MKELTELPSPQVRRAQELAVHKTVRQMIRLHKKQAAQMERRQHGRTDFVQTVTVRTEDQREFILLSRDLSEQGVRLIGTRGLLGQKVQVTFAGSEGEMPVTFVVRILWTCSVGEGLFENGGNFLQIVKSAERAH